VGGQQSTMFKSILQKWFLISAIAAFVTIAQESYCQQHQNPEGQPKWFDPDWQDSSLKETGKKLDIIKDISQPGPDIEFLYSKASELLKRSIQERDNLFRCERLINAADALLNAAYGIFSSRKADRIPQDFWGVGKALPSLHFRVQQAGFFASRSGEKNTEQYVKLARSIYQQARSAYDAHEYQKAKFLADASFSVVTALESIAQAAIPAPAAPRIFK
jgi:hypothetical protein